MVPVAAATLCPVALTRSSSPAVAVAVACPSRPTVATAAPVMDDPPAVTPRTVGIAGSASRPAGRGAPPGAGLTPGAAAGWRRLPGRGVLERDAAWGPVARAPDAARACAERRGRASGVASGAGRLPDAGTTTGGWAELPGGAG